MEKIKTYNDIVRLLKTYNLLVIQQLGYDETNGHYIIIVCSNELVEKLKRYIPYDFELTNGDKYFGTYWIKHINFN